jgi:hypothetical protein
MPELGRGRLERGILPAPCGARRPRSETTEMRAGALGPLAGVLGSGYGRVPPSNTEPAE